MSTIKSDSADLTLNCDGGSSSLKIQIDGTEKASISSAGLFSSTSIDATKLSGSLPALDGSSLTGVGVDGISSASTSGTAINIDSANNVGIQSTPESHHSTWTSLQFGGTGNITGQTAQSANKQVVIANNAYVDSTETWSHIVTDEASMYRQMGGKHTFLVAPSGTADANLAISTALEIKNDGSVTMPSQPAFQAYQTSGQGNLPYQTWHSVDFGTERFDQGSNYSGAGFTAPVTGKYLLSANVEVDQNASGSFIFLRMRTSNQSYYNMNGQAATDYQSNSITVLADMDANDTAYVDVYMSTGSTADITAGLYTYWSGYLVA